MKYSGQSVLTKLIQLIKSKFDSLANVATSGDYNDLINIPDIGNVVVREIVTIGSDNTSVIGIPIAISNTESLAVYQNGLLLTEDTHYTVTNSTITLIGYTANAGDIFNFVMSSDTGTTFSAQASAVMFTDTTEDNCYANCDNVQEALIHAAEFNPTITEVKVNDLALTPDSNKSINIDLSGKVDKESGKGLSTNDYTTAEKTKLNGIREIINYTASLSVAGWVGTSAPYTQTVNVSGILVTDTPLVDVLLSTVQMTAEAEIEAYSCISKVETDNGSITATCFKDKPDTYLTLMIKVV